MSRPMIVATALLAALALGACGNTNASQSDVREVLEDAGATADQADCAAKKLDDELSQDELNQLADAETVEDIEGDEKLNETVAPILDECLRGEAPAEGSDAEGESTSTTESETTSTTGESTSTTEG